MSYPAWISVNAGDRMLQQSFTTTAGPFYQILARLDRLHRVMTYRAPQNTTSGITFSAWPMSGRPRNAIGGFLEQAYSVLSSMAAGTGSYTNGTDTKRPGKILKNSNWTNYTGPMSTPQFTSIQARQPVNWLRAIQEIRAALDAMKYVERPVWTMQAASRYWRFAEVPTSPYGVSTAQTARPVGWWGDGEGDPDAYDHINQNSSTNPADWTPDWPGKDQDLSGDDVSDVPYNARVGIVRHEWPLPLGQVYAWTSRDDRVRGQFYRIASSLGSVQRADILFYANPTLRYTIASNKGTPSITGDWGALRAFLRVTDADPGLSLTLPAYPRPTEEIIFDWRTTGNTADTDYTLTSLDKDITVDYQDKASMWLNEAVGYDAPTTAATPSQFAQADGAVAQVNTARLSTYSWSASTIAKLWTRTEVNHAS